MNILDEVGKILTPLPTFESVYGELIARSQPKSQRYGVTAEELDFLVKQILMSDQEFNYHEDSTLPLYGYPDSRIKVVILILVKQFDTNKEYMSLVRQIADDCKDVIVKNKAKDLLAYWSANDEVNN